ncbi:MAG: glycosyltransferase family 1 protein [Anaerolineae bacterium]
MTKLYRLRHSTAEDRRLQTILAAEARAVAHHTIASENTCRAVQRVAIFTEAFLPKVDGVSRTALLTIRHLQQTGRKVIVFAPWPAPSHIAETPIYAVPSLWLPSYPETRVAPPSPFVLPTLRRFQPDLIHLFSPFSLGAIGMVAGGWLRVPVVANYQTDLPAYTKIYGAEAFYSAFTGILRYLHNGCTLNLAPTAIVRRGLAASGFKRLRVWERGVDTHRFNPMRRTHEWRQRLLNGRDPDRLVVLYVGRFAREKRLETLRLIAADRRFALTLVGGGHHEGEVRRALCEGGADPHFIGYQLGDDLANAYAAADIFAFCGTAETFGQVVLEAMASGLPALVPDRGGVASLVADGERGFICRADDASDFHAKALSLAEDAALRSKMSHAARQYAEAQSWTQVMYQLERYYAEAVCLYGRYRKMQQA